MLASTWSITNLHVEICANSQHSILLAQNGLAIAMRLSVRIKAVEVTRIWALEKGARKNTTNGKLQIFDDSEASG